MALQDSHTAHCSPRLPLTARFPGKTSCKSPVKIGALITRFIVAHMVKETKHRRTLTNRYSSDRHSADRLAVQAVCYANLVMSTTLPIPLSASLTAERRSLLFSTLSPAQIERIAPHGKRNPLSTDEIHCDPAV